MNDYLISLYLDNELDLDEKITFVEQVHADRIFTDEALALLRQEKLVRTLPEHQLPFALPPVDDLPTSVKSLWRPWWKPFAGLVAAGALATLLLVFLPSRPDMITESHRFVLYLPDIPTVEIIGTFTDWQPVTMVPIGNSGYWTLTMDIPEGEHRYSYLIGHERQIADPTVAIREQDDFGGENSILEVRRTAI